VRKEQELPFYDVKCTRSKNEFDLGTAGSDESKIVSLVLSDTAAHIIRRGKSSVFTKLVMIKDSGIETVAESALSGYTKFENIDIPEAIIIKESIFSGCTALEGIKIPSVRIIGKDTDTSTGFKTFTITLGVMSTLLEEKMFDDALPQLPKRLSISRFPIQSPS
jgi:hypothetical protein